jgi:hypothetical protein
MFISVKSLGALQEKREELGWKDFKIRSLKKKSRRGRAAFKSRTRSDWAVTFEQNHPAKNGTASGISRILRVRHGQRQHEEAMLNDMFFLRS